LLCATKISKTVPASSLIFEGEAKLPLCFYGYLSSWNKSIKDRKIFDGKERPTFFQRYQQKERKHRIKNRKV